MPQLTDVLFEQAPFGLAIVDSDLRYRRVNARLAQMHGPSVSEHVGRAVRDLRPGPTGAGIEAAVREVLETGRPLSGVLIQGPTVSQSAPRHFVCSYLPFGDAVLAIVQDDTDRVQAERERSRLLRAAHAAQARTATLQAVTEAVNEALSPEDVATRIVAESRRATGAVAGVVAALEGGSSLRILHEVGYEATPNRRIVPLDLHTPLGLAVREERMVLLHSAQDRAEYADAPTFELEAGAYVPLIYEGHAVGAMGLGFSAPGQFDEEERAFLIAVGRQCAQAMVRAQLYEQRSFVARRLQRQLLPQRVPSVEWLETASSYRALGEGTEVGGDFYDLMPADHGWAALIGDVQGKGIDAAGVAGAARHIIRGLARALDDPALIVQGANEALVADLDVDRFVTLALVLCTRAERRRARARGLRRPPAAAGAARRRHGRARGQARPDHRRRPRRALRVQPTCRSPRVTRSCSTPTASSRPATAASRSATNGSPKRWRPAHGGSAEDVVRAVTSAVMAFEGPQARDDQAVLCLRAR